MSTNPQATDPNFYMAADYCATGEGRTLMFMVTRAYGSVDEPPNLTREDIARRQFVRQFGNYMAMGVEFFDRETFLEKYGNLIPDLVKNLTTNQATSTGHRKFTSTSPKYDKTPYGEVP